MKQIQKKIQSKFRGLFGLENGNESSEKRSLKERRQAYRIMDENQNAVKVESYEVDVYVDPETGEVTTEVDAYLWGRWFEKGEIHTWPDPLAQTYLAQCVGDSIATSDFWMP